MNDSQDKIEAKRALDLIRCGRAIHATLDRIDEAMERSLEINRTDLRCLNLLEHGPLTPKEIGRRLDLTSGSVTPLVDRLVERGLVSRRPSDHDRRSSVIALQTKAFEQLGGRYRLVADAIMQEFADLDDIDHAKAVKNLDSLIRALERGLDKVSDVGNEE
ncbi:MAG: MarR family transcriptional regulator [Planctomycetota bacterium]